MFGLLCHVLVVDVSAATDDEDYIFVPSHRLDHSEANLELHTEQSVECSQHKTVIVSCDYSADSFVLRPVSQSQWPVCNTVRDVYQHKI